jgi:prepilin-type N-terminal cleavage/methylation domain-containing protein
MPGHRARQAPDRERHGPQARGFTLFELLVMVAVIGILVTIAVPEYQAYVARDRLGLAATLAHARDMDGDRLFDTGQYREAAGKYQLELEALSASREFGGRESPPGGEESGALRAQLQVVRTKLELAQIGAELEKLQSPMKGN